jgi:hypothetical protein
MMYVDDNKVEMRLDGIYMVISQRLWWMIYCVKNPRSVVDVYVDRDGGDPDVVFGLYVFLVLGAYSPYLYSGLEDVSRLVLRVL